MFRLDFTTRVLGEAAADRLRQKAVTQTLTGTTSSIVGALLHNGIKVGDYIEVALDEEVIDLACVALVDRIPFDSLENGDAERGGFDTVAECRSSLLRAGYRSLLYRVLFNWRVEEVI